MESLLEDNSIPGNVPAFLSKLWKLVEDPTLDSLISWNKNGQTFKVHDQIQFSKEVLPKYYKHSNFSSFVRQVNMYGFRKIIDPTSGSLKSEKDEWEFFHPSFHQGKPSRLDEIKRKTQTKEHETKATTNQVTNLFSEVERLKQEHESVAIKLENVKKENELLWSEVSDLREQHKDQQNVINKLIQVFVKIVMANKNDISRGVKRRALNFPAIETKVPRQTQDILPYNNTVYSVQSPISPNRLIELPDDTITVISDNQLNQNNGNTTILESSDVNVPEDNITSELTETNAVDISAFVPATKPMTGTKNHPFVVKSNSKTITILPSTGTVAKKSKPGESTIDQQLLSNNTGFVFPEKYIEKPAIVTGPLAIEAAPLSFQLSTDLENVQTDNNLRNITHSQAPNALVIPDDSNVLLTPFSEQPVSVTNSLVPTVNFQPMTTPVLALPPQLNHVFTRQESFKDRKEISDNVEKINKSIEVLQDILENQPVSLDVKSLNMMTDILPDNLSIQDLAKMLGPQDDDHEKEIENDVTEGQLIPYNDPPSPSQYMNTQFTSSTDLLNEVLGK